MSDAESEMENNEDSTLFDDTLFDVQKFHKSTANADKVPRASSLEQKKLVLKIISYFQQKKISARLSGNKDFENVVKRKAECLGISERIVKRVSKEAANSEELREPHQMEGRPSIYVDDFFIGVIRRKLFNFYMAKTFPSVEKLLKKLIDDVPDFPKISTMTLWRILKKNNFSYKK